jgi:predicted RNA-binding protein YlqC (UPF0109 family)
MTSNKIEALSTEDFVELSEYIDDTLRLLVNVPDRLAVAVTYGETNDGDPVDEILVSIDGPRSEIAMFVGRGGETVKALHRVFYSVARRMGWKGSVRLSWEPLPEAEFVALIAEAA